MPVLNLALRNDFDAFERDPFDWRTFFSAATGLCRDIGNAFQNVVPGDEFTERGILVVEELGVAVDEEKLRTRGIGMRGAGHRNHAAHMGLFIELRFDFVAGAAGAGHAAFAFLGVGATSLDHETLDDAMKGGAVIKSLAGEFLEILDRLWRDIGPEREGHFAVAGFKDGDFVGGRSGFAHGKANKPGARLSRKEEI